MAQPLPHVLGALGSCGTERLMCVGEDGAAQRSCPAHAQLLSHHLMDVAGSHVPLEELTWEMSLATLRFFHGQPLALS